MPGTNTAWVWVGRNFCALWSVAGCGKVGSWCLARADAKQKWGPWTSLTTISSRSWSRGGVGCLYLSVE
eukprot:scaffold28681_cov129-Isochrysis_galbana.AAC.5